LLMKAIRWCRVLDEGEKLTFEPFIEAERMTAWGPELL
jgi:hypothetical protein